MFVQANQSKSAPKTLRRKIKLIGRLRSTARFVEALIHPLDRPAVAGEGAFVVEVGLAVVADPAGGDGIVARVGGVAEELPGKQDLALFEH